MINASGAIKNMYDSHLICKVANKCLNVRKRVKVVEWNKRWSTPFPSCPVSRQCPWKKTLTEKKNHEFQFSLVITDEFTFGEETLHWHIPIWIWLLEQGHVSKRGIKLRLKITEILRIPSPKIFWVITTSSSIMKCNITTEFWSSSTKSPTVQKMGLENVWN